MPLAWIAWMRQQKRGFWFARDPRDYWINPNLQNILHLRQHRLPVLDYIRMMHPEDQPRVVNAIERSGRYLPEAIAIRHPVRIQSMPGVWLSFTTVAVLVKPGPDFLYVGRASRHRCDD